MKISVGIEHNSTNEYMYVCYEGDTVKFVCHKMRATRHVCDELKAILELYQNGAALSITVEAMTDLTGKDKHMNFGLTRGLLIAYGLPYTVVTRKTWTKVVGCEQMEGEDNLVYFMRKHEIAKRLYPALSIDKRSGNALLLCRYSKLVFKS
jgi:hypothetical protein